MIGQIEEGDTKEGIIIPKNKFKEFVGFQDVGGREMKVDKELYVVVHPASSPIEDEKWRWLDYPKQLVHVIKEAIISLLL